MKETRTVRVGLLGLGIVGGATARILIEHADDLAQRSGARVELVTVAVRTLTKPREVELPDGVLTSDAWAVVNHPEVDVVIEAIGGIEPARDLILAAIKSGKHVVTANKELMSTLGREVMDAAETAGVDVLFEASVGGGIPIIRPLKESLAGERVRRVMGIVNGTTNFILTRMSETGESFPEALAEAERLGYTELDPSADIEGFDAAAKLAILASLAFNARVVAGDVDREGISSVTATDINAAHELGYVVKLLAVAEEDGGEISARVHPAMLPQAHPLAAVRDVFNAVFIEGDEVGELMFFGRGAGGGPTGTAVVGDLVEVVRNIVGGGRSPGCTCYRDDARMRPRDEAKARYYIVLSVADQAGVLSSVAGVFAQHDVSIASVRQEGSGDEATLVLITHVATEGQHQLTLRDLSSLSSVKNVDSTMRVVGTSEA
ncbi:MAG: homoserine dehydrogenase [Actinomycetota bacterium]|jgi:homoserine dehydrogenase|nr:homoserine dehydrogenase [Actinomycetota bacterium]